MFPGDKTRQTLPAARSNVFPAWAWALCLLLSAVFLWAGSLKAADPAAFLRDIFNHRIVPPPLDVLAALYVPWLEILVALALLVPAWRAGGALIAGLLFIAFALVTAQAWLRGLDVECGCFGPALRHDNMALSLFTNLAGLASAMAILSADRKKSQGTAAQASSSVS